MKDAVLPAVSVYLLKPDVARVSLAGSSQGMQGCNGRTSGSVAAPHRCGSVGKLRLP